MRRAIFPLFCFFVIIVGLIYSYPKLHFREGGEKTLLHDKPVACTLCGVMMWNGPQGHVCADSFLETH
jgi:hypothetical protein